MRVLVPILATTLLLGCPLEPSSISADEEWQQVLELEKGVGREGENKHDQQLYADAVRSFLESHPDHREAVLTYEVLELAFARQLVIRGRLTAAAIHYESVLSRNPDHSEAAEELETIEARRQLDPNLMARLESGMTSAEVESVLGAPRPGWRRTTTRANQVSVSWYYPSGDGTTAIHFINGELVAVDP